ncbi:MAG: YoaP domain-containing protein [Methanobacterium sp.]|nr:YoaP domain-containing protein [Methanobacterium sp.]MBV1754357.1 YoaP domain-containing protein [Methanobacterium sp.]MBV1766837.1 YoaP domain-containing protein [Methanobacterium sp.]
MLKKNVKGIIELAQNKYKLKTNLIDLNDARDVQNSPCAFGSFCLIYNGEILSYHPISKTRFENIMKKALP